MRWTARVAMVVGLLAWALAGVGCASSGSGEFKVEAGSYAAAFDATREVLRDFRFDLERVDAAQGVITTDAKRTAGLATPWDSEQSDLVDEFDDFFNDQRRRVRVVFEPLTAEGGVAEVGGGDSYLEHDGPFRARVEVTIYRVQTYGLRISPKAVRFPSYTRNPELIARGIPAVYEVPLRQDAGLASELAGKIERRAGRGG